MTNILRLLCTSICWLQDTFVSISRLLDTLTSILDTDTIYRLWDTLTNILRLLYTSICWLQDTFVNISRLLDTFTSWWLLGTARFFLFCLLVNYTFTNVSRLLYIFVNISRLLDTLTSI